MCKNCRIGKATDDNVVHAHSMPDTLGYKHILRIWNTLLKFLVVYWRERKANKWHCIWSDKKVRPSI